MSEIVQTVELVFPVLEVSEVSLCFGGVQALLDVILEVKNEGQKMLKQRRLRRYSAEVLPQFRHR